MNRQLIAKRLIDLRGKRTQEEVSKSIGVSKSALSMYETGQRIPRDEVKVKISAFYGKSIQSIFFNPQ